LIDRLEKLISKIPSPRPKKDSAAIGLSVEVGGVEKAEIDTVPIAPETKERVETEADPGNVISLK
jgi:hypothetical protein